MRRYVAALLLLLAACSRRHDPSPATAAQSASPEVPGVFHGRVIAPVMSYEGADWLERSDRLETEQPDRVVLALEIQPGSTVADVGAGTGYFTVRLARAVGPRGRVVATDLQAQMLTRLRQNLAEAGLDNVELLQTTDTDAKLPKAALDLALMVDVYHELGHPKEVLDQVRAALKPSGRLVLVEYRGEDPSVPIKEEHKMTLAQVRLEVEGEGFVLAKVLEFLPQQRVIVFVVSSP